MSLKKANTMPMIVKMTAVHVQRASFSSKLGVSLQVLPPHASIVKPASTRQWWVLD